LKRKDQRRAEQARAYREQALQARAEGRFEDAVAAMRRSVELVDELLAQSPDHAGLRYEKASALYTMGALLVATGLPEQAITVLFDSEELYRELPIAESARFIVDVQIRRAGAQAAAGQGASAVVTVDEAVTNLSEIDNPPRLDVARTMARAGGILLRYGDPDLAVACADVALRIYLNQGDGSGLTITLHGDDAGYVLESAAVAALIHLSAGRKVGMTPAYVVGAVAAPDALDLLARAGSVNDRSREPDQSILAQLIPLMRAALRNVWQTPADLEGLPGPTLAQALTLGDDPGPQLARALTKPAIDGTLVIPSQRTSPQVAPAYAMQLADLAVATLTTRPAQGLRMGLEAHALFAAASRAQVPAMRYQMVEFGPSWAGVLLALIANRRAADDTAFALDLGSWSLGTAQALAPFAMMSPDAARLARDCLRQYGELLLATGDREFGERLLADSGKFPVPEP
jgi:tetratricopeptide (TPR) repeat protein